MTPWIFGDEYLYLSKARNIRQGIDVLADVNVGHTYPPLYSYLLSLVIGNDPYRTYQYVQWLNVATNQVFLIASLLLLNKVFRWTKTIQGWIFLLLAYVLLSTSTLMTGYHFVAMSENLYTPLVMFIFSLFVYAAHLLKPDLKRTGLIFFSLGLFTALAILTRTIGVVLVPAVVLGTLVFAKKNMKSWQRKASAMFIGLLSTISVVVLFDHWEKNQIVHTLLVQQNYDELSIAYQGVLEALVSGRMQWFSAVKIVGNHVSYILFASFFFPILFVIRDGLKTIQIKKIDPILMFFLAFSGGSAVVSFLHSYSGFLTNPIRYSTYFRYIDQVVVILILYGLIRLWEWYKSKERIRSLAFATWISVCLIGILFLPERDFYVTLNSFGWAWLDIFQQTQWLIKIVAIQLIVIGMIILKRKRLYPILLASIIGLQVLSLPVIVRMHQWLGSSFQTLNGPVRQVAQEMNIQNFYIVGDFTEKGLLGEMYYMKYLMLFYGDNFTPIEIDAIGNLEDLPRPYAYIDARESDLLKREYFDQVISVDDKVGIGIRR
jgi:hypothetical protein